MDKWEREERLKRRNCVIVHGLEESQAVEGVERREADQVLVSEMFGVMNCGEVRTDKVIRLGKKKCADEWGVLKTKTAEVGLGI